MYVVLLVFLTAKEDYNTEHWLWFPTTAPVVSDSGTSAERRAALIG